MRTWREVVWLSKPKKIGGPHDSCDYTENGHLSSIIIWTLSTLDLSTHTKCSPDRQLFAVIIPANCSNIVVFGPNSRYNVWLSAVDLVKYCKVSVLSAQLRDVVPSYSQWQSQKACCKCCHALCVRTTFHTFPAKIPKKIPFISKLCTRQWLSPVLILTGIVCCRLIMLWCKLVWWYICMFSLLPYCFVNGNLYVANDPLGRQGPSRDAILHGGNWRYKLLFMLLVKLQECVDD